MFMPIAAGTAGLGCLTGLLGYLGLRRKGMHRWLWPYLTSRHTRHTWQPGEPLDVYIAVCDHYEPKRGGATPAKAKGRVQEWLDKYPALFSQFQDSAGRPPQHTFFYPEDEYEPELVDMVASLCRQGYGDVEIHLHHDHDTAEGLREKLIRFKTTLFERHGLLRRDPDTGDITYGFIHGNWALDNSRSDGRWCGVDNELDVLVETSCYADFTMPSAPSETQTRMINTIYWAQGRKNQRKSHNFGVPVASGPRPERGLLMIPGPLGLDWSQRKFGLLPGIENGNLQNNQPPTEKRLANWLRACVNLPMLTSSVAVKLHTHGVHEPNQEVLLGDKMVKLHAHLRRLSSENANFRYYYVTAWELARTVLSAVTSNKNHDTTP